MNMVEPEKFGHLHLVYHFTVPLKKQEIQDIFIKTNQAKHVFSMIWLMEILKVYQEEQLLMKYYMIKHLMLLKIQIMTDINADLLQSFINTLIKSPLLLVDANKSATDTGTEFNSENQQLVEELHKPFTILENLENVEYTYGQHMDC